ncbi:MAG: TonB family protein, partial [Chitinophagaceae bacterium]|nr:TonB family protein [Chitinophagaceae bacterium]
AYCLRKEYNRRLNIALIVTGLFVSLLILLYFFNSGKEKQFIPLVDPDITIVNLAPDPEIKKPEIIKPPKPLAIPVKLKTVQYTTPVIVKNNDVPKDEKPVEIDALDNVRIGLANMDGAENIDGIAPPQGSGNGVIGGISDSKKETDTIAIFVQIESSYPGGQKAWSRYLNKTFSYPQNAVDNRIQGPVTVRFIVDINGVVSNVEAVNGPEDLKAEAIRVIKKSGKWNPAIQNGRTVKSYKEQRINFVLNEE